MSPHPHAGEVSKADQCDVVVVGAGITGAATAHALAVAGTDVLLIDAHDPATRASGSNAGSLHAQIQHEPFCTLGDEWAKAFLPALGLLDESLRVWRQLSQELGVDLHVYTAGGLLVASDPEQMRQIARKADLERSIGIEVDVLDASELRIVAPYVSDKMIGAGLWHNEGKADALSATNAYVTSAQRHGARVSFGPKVLAVTPGKSPDSLDVLTDRGSIRSRRVVVATGADSAPLVEALGKSLPISSDPMQVSVTQPVEPLIAHLVYFAGARLTIKQSSFGHLLIGGGWPAKRVNDSYATVDPSSLVSNLALACEVVPAVSSSYILRTWAAFNNGVVDQMPIIGELIPGVIFGTFPYLGFTAGPMMGRILAALALGIDPGIDISPYSPDRFAPLGVM